jgi:hypothetical protein
VSNMSYQWHIQLTIISLSKARITETFIVVWLDSQINNFKMITKTLLHISDVEKKLIKGKEAKKIAQSPSTISF